MKKRIFLFFFAAIFATPITILFAEEQNTSLSEIDELSSIGVSLLHQGKYGEAISYFDKILQIDPTDTIALANKGAALTHLGKYEDAITYYDKALTIDPKNTSILNNKAATLFEMKKIDEVLTTLDAILEITPDNIDTMMQKGQVLLEAKKYSDAFSTFNRILEFEPKNEEAQRGSFSAIQEIKLIPTKGSKYLGHVILELRNSNGVLVSVTQTDALGFLPHHITDEFLDETPVLEKITINGKLYEKREFIEKLDVIEDTFIGRATLGYDRLGYDVYPFDILPHGIVVVKDDKLTACWTILREIT